VDVIGKTAIITGATKGIGRAIAKALVRAEVNVSICGRSEDDLHDAVSDLNQIGKAQATGTICDVRNYDEVTALFDHTVQTFGGVDILVNNAGIGIFTTVEEMTPEDFRAVLETNVFGVFYCCHQAIPLMKQRGGGYIINISSLAGANPHPQMAAYNASKFGLNGFSEALMQEIRHDGIKVTYIMPGSVNTEFGGDEPDENKSWQLQPQDIALAVIDLLHHPGRSLASRVEMRPSKPPKKS
jgi:NAD(P)-dependent dehydrogenase (short-subunit alcohol dehydrogenase family)